MPLANPRSIAFIVTLLAMFVHKQWMWTNRENYSWAGQSISLIRIVMSLLVFELVTIDTWAYFERSIHISAGPGYSNNHRFYQARQAALSTVWVLYSILLMGLGIMKRYKSIRIMAIILFYLTTFKVFLYDLSSLETLYRIFSFIGLGLILLATSYLYQRYRGLIIGEQADENG